MPLVGASKTLIIVTFLTETMTNNIKEWADTFDAYEIYAERIMDSMDMKTMEQFVFDTLCENLSMYSPEDLLTEINEYDEGLMEHPAIEKLVAETGWTAE